MKRIAVCLIAVFASISILAAHTATYASETAEVVENIDFVTIEAEDMLLGDDISVIQDKEASGSSAVKVIAESDLELKDIDDFVTPSLRKEINISKIGRYAVWLRFKAVSAAGDSFHYSVNKQAWTTSHNDGSVGKGYQWIRIGVEVVKDNKLSVKFKYREPGFIFDKLFVTDNTSVTPVGVLPQTVVNTINTEDYWPIPSVKPIEGHPRLFVTPERVEYIRNNLGCREWKAAYNTVVEGGNNETDTPTRDMIMYRALLWLLGDADEAHALKTIKYAKEYLGTVTYPNVGDITRTKGNDMVMGAIVYDWCYDLLTEEDKTFFINVFKYIASIKESHYPPVGTGHQIGEHDGEGEIFKDLLSAGVAMYDEDSEMYNLAAGRLFDQMIESRRMFHHAGRNSNGTNYGIERTRFESYAALIFDRMGYKDLFDRDANGEYSEEYGKGNLNNVPYTWLYERLPFGLWVKEGNSFLYTNYKYENGYSNYDALLMLNVSGIYSDPYIRGQWVKELSMSNYSLQPFWNIVLGTPDTEFKITADDLPLTRVTTYPLTAVEARTDWQDGLDGSTVVAKMLAFEKITGEHEHMDMGSFSIYYKGTLTMDGGRYNGSTGGWGQSHFMNYMTQSIASNTMNVYVPGEKFDWLIADNVREIEANTGGQQPQDYIKTMEAYRATPDLATTEGLYVGPNEKTPEFSYVKTDLTNSYSEKVSKHKRSMVFMNLFDSDYPAAMVVYDNVTSTHPEAKKTFLMQSIEEPSIDGNKSVIQRKADERFTGKLTNITMLPENPLISKVGGPGMDSWVDGKNYPNESDPDIDDEQGEWRLEISPAEKSDNDVFLNAIYVSDGADEDLPELPMYKDDFVNHVGVTVKDRMVLFSKSANPISSTFRIRIRENEAPEVSCLVTDVAEGVWKVEGSGSPVYVEVKKGENALYFKGVPGEYVITKADGQEPDEIEYPETEYAKTGDFLMCKGKQFIYQDKPTKLIDGVPYIPLKEVAERLGAVAEVNENDNSVSITKNERTMTVYRNKFKAIDDENDITLRYAPVVFDGVVYGAFADYASLLACTYSYDDYASIMKIYDTSTEFVSFEFQPSNMFFNRVAEYERIVVPGTKYRFKLQDEDNGFTIPDNGYVSYYKNGKELGKIFAGGEVVIPITAGRNAIYAKLFSAKGAEIGRSKKIVINAGFYAYKDVLVDYDWDDNKNGYIVGGTSCSIDENYGMSNKIVAPSAYKGDGVSPLRTEYPIYQNKKSANFLEYDNDILEYKASYYFEDFNVDRNICYTGGADIFQVTVAASDNSNSTYLLVGSANGSNPAYSSGNVPVMKLQTGTWYEFRRIFNTATGVVTLYVNDEFVHQEKYDDLIACKIREFKNADFSNSWSGFKTGDTASYFIDNVKVRTLEYSESGVADIMCEYTDVPAGTELSFKVDAVLGSGNNLSYYRNGVRLGDVVDGGFKCVINAGINEIYVRLDGTDKESPVTVVNGLDYKTEKVYYDVDFSDGTENLSLINIGGVNSNGEFINGKYKITVMNNCSSIPMLRMSEWNAKPNAEKGVYMWEIEATYGKFHYGRDENGNNIGFSRYPIKVNLPKENNARLPLFYLDWLPSDISEYGYANLKINNIDTGIDIMAGETHTYKVILDTENGVGWFYLDGKLISQENDFAKGKVLGRTDFEAGNLAGTEDIFDNIRLYKLIDKGSENSFLCYNDGNEISSLSEFNSAKPLVISSVTYNRKYGYDHIIEFDIVKDVTENRVVSVKAAPISFENECDYVIVNSVIDKLPSDINSGRYKVFHYLWAVDNGGLIPLEDCKCL